MFHIEQTHSRRVPYAQGRHAAHVDLAPYQRGEPDDRGVRPLEARQLPNHTVREEQAHHETAGREWWGLREEVLQRS